MKYIKSNRIDHVNTYFHFSRIDNRKSIETNGLQAVAGGENEAARDRENKTIYFSKGFVGLLKAVDVWARWEYSQYARTENGKGHYIKQEYEDRIIDGEDNSYDREVMSQIVFKKVYDDFKNRQYYALQLTEGENGDFQIGDIDVKKILSRDRQGKPYPGPLWKYGPYSDFGTPENPNNRQEDWNMNTKFGDRTISSKRLRIIETQGGRSDALSVLIETYDQYRKMLPGENDKMYEILDDFIAYAKERYKSDIDFQEGSPDYGRRDIKVDEQTKYQSINKITLNNNKSSLFSFISKIINKIKNRRKRLPRVSQTDKPSDTVEEKPKNTFLEDLKELPGEYTLEQKIENTQAKQNNDISR